MGYRDILVQIDETKASRDRAIAAAGLAARMQAQLTGVFLKSEFLRSYMAGEVLAYLPPQTIEQLLREHAAGVAKASETARALFEDAARAAGVKSDWLIIEGEDGEALSATARRFDLTVMPPTVTATLGWRHLSVTDVAFASGGPALVMPGKATPTIGEKILVAWKGTHESARALHDAWPLVEKARQVHVLIVDPEGEAGPEGLLQRHFERHGCKANLIVDRSQDAAAGDILRRQVADLGVDLVVMGLYGRSRLQEMVLGGVSRDMLGDPPAALFVSH
jgi:nucleotide-binding universal stress UspA family protein